MDGNEIGGLQRRTNGLRSIDYLLLGEVLVVRYRASVVLKYGFIVGKLQNDSCSYHIIIVWTQEILLTHTSRDYVKL